MRFTLLITAICGSLATGSRLHPHRELYNEKLYAAEDIIRRDVAIVGGNAAGVYAAVRLKDFDKSVILMEAEETLGGQSKTYTAANGDIIEYGTNKFLDNDLVKDFFGRFNVSLVRQPRDETPNYWHFKTGIRAYLVDPPTREEEADAFGRYIEQLEKYSGLRNGFGLAKPVEKDLTLTFRQFVKKYRLQAMVPSTYIALQGFEKLMDTDMLYVFKALTADHVNAIGNGYLTTQNHDISELYRKAQRHLGPASVYTNSTPLVLSRAKGHVRIVLTTPKGRKLIIAKKLITATPPFDNGYDSSLFNINDAYDLGTGEAREFSYWESTGSYTALIANTGLTFPPGDIYALNPRFGEGTQSLPTHGGISRIRSYPDSNLLEIHHTLQGGPIFSTSQWKIKHTIAARLRHMQKMQGVPVSKKFEWKLFRNNGPVNLRVPGDMVKGGFYERLEKRQGDKNCFWVGAAWQSEDEAEMWRFVEERVLGMVLDALDS